jgi:hypothetical protein
LIETFGKGEWLMRIASARGAIEVEEVTFTSGLDYREDGSLYRIADPNGPDYVGAPSKEVDAAWKELIHGKTS